MKRLMLAGCIALVGVLVARNATCPEEIPPAATIFAKGRIGKVVRVDYMDHLVHRQTYGTIIAYDGAQYIHCGHAGTYGHCITVYEDNGAMLGNAYLQKSGLYRIIHVTPELR